MAGIGDPSTRPGLTLQRRLHAPPAKVYVAWTDPTKIIHWFGPSHVVVGSARAELDVRTGGRFRVSFSTSDGEYHEVGGTYREVVPEQKLVFSWSWHSTPERESQVTVSLKPDGKGTLLTLQHDQLFDQTARDGHTRGWTGSLDRLEVWIA
jgi:uncharacterized protein YndB with AHSA1/START domain